MEKKTEKKAESKTHIYRKLFSSTFYLSAFTFGGGYVIIPLMKRKFVDELKWIDEKEMLNLTAIAQSSPGPVAVNASILLGYRVAGIRGALFTISGTILPPLLILSVLSFFYESFRQNVVVHAVLKGMQAGVAAVIADVVINLGGSLIGKKSKFDDILSAGILTGSFVAAYVLKINVIYIILICGCLGAVKVLMQENKSKGDGAGKC